MVSGQCYRFPWSIKHYEPHEPGDHFLDLIHAVSEITEADGVPSPFNDVTLLETWNGAPRCVEEYADFRVIFPLYYDTLAAEHSDEARMRCDREGVRVVAKTDAGIEWLARGWAKLTGDAWTVRYRLPQAETFHGETGFYRDLGEARKRVNALVFGNGFAEAVVVHYARSGAPGTVVDRAETL